MMHGLLIACIDKHPVYNCGHGTNPIDDKKENSVQCSSRLIWHVTKFSKTKPWFNISCYK